MKTNAIVSLRYVVNSIMNERNIDDKDYNRIMQLVMDGFTESNIYHTFNIEVAYVTVSNINTIDMPSDMIDITSFGIIREGNIWTLTRNDTIPLPRSSSCGTDTNDNAHQGADDSTSIYYAYTDHFRDGIYIPVMYGMTGGFNDAYYRMDWEMRRIILQGTVPLSQAVIEYKSSGIDLSGSTQVKRQWVEPLRTYVHWKMAEFDGSTPFNEKERKHRLYIEAVKMAHSFDCAFTMDEFLDTRYANFKQTVKR